MLPQIIIWRYKSKGSSQADRINGYTFDHYGKKKFDYTHGVDRNRSLKKKRLHEKVERVHI